MPIWTVRLGSSRPSSTARRKGVPCVYLLTPKYCVSTRAEIAGGGTGKCVSAQPGSARFTSSATNCEEQTFTSCGVRAITAASPARECSANTHRERPSTRWSVTSPSQK